MRVSPGLTGSTALCRAWICSWGRDDSGLELVLESWRGGWEFVLG